MNCPALWSKFDGLMPDEEESDAIVVDAGNIRNDEVSGRGGGRPSDESFMHANLKKVLAANGVDVKDVILNEEADKEAPITRGEILRFYWILLCE
jgi:hypothetical protein